MYKAFDAVGVRPTARMEIGNNEAIKHAVANGLGLSVLSLHTLSLEGIDGPVAILDVEGFPVLRNWYMVYPKGKELSLVAQTFLDFVISSESKIRERMQKMWPKLEDILKLAEESEPVKKKANKKKVTNN